MAAIQPGTGGTFKTETAEGRAIETLCFLQLQEATAARNPESRNAVSGDFSIEELTFSGTFVLPAEQTISNEGNLTIIATPYLQGVTFSPGGSTPTFKSTVLERYALEVLMYLQLLERDAVKNPQNRNFITGNFNSDTGIYSGVFTLPVSLVVNSTGIPQFEAVEYLIT
ncbi:MAG: hypothetical protein IGS48_02430 [Oscillatoriales cyanobacterium C42_A2020_001]|nr:hypothetical protein [Leptolyngbyaceae cyanobacterium C42_A2020_001]